MVNFGKSKVAERRAGLTLIEVLIATLLVGIAIASLVMCSAAFTKANGFGIDLSTAEFLIEEVRERTVPMQFDDLDAFAGTYSPPQDVQGNQLNDFAAFTQQVTVQNVSASNFGTPEAGSDFAKVTVSILLNSRQISSASWIRARY